MLNILDQIQNVSKNIKWKDIEKFCKDRSYTILSSKKGYKVYIGSSVWSVHLEHRTSDELKHGIIRELRKILVKEKVI